MKSPLKLNQTSGKAMIDITHLFFCFLLTVTTLGIGCSQLPEISAKKKSAITSAKPVLQQVNSVSKDNSFQNKIAQNSNTTVKPNETQNQILLQAIKNQDLEGVNAALANGADANAGYPNYFPALVLAAIRGNLAIFNTLLEAGADASTKNLYGDTALTLAQQNSYPQIVELLKQAE